MLVTEDAYARGGVAVGDSERRRLELRGKREPTDVRVVQVAPARVPEAVQALAAAD